MANPQPLPGARQRAVRQRRSAALPPVQARAQATREALLAAGRRLLAERDFDALAIADLAAAIGMSVGSFYGRFPDKQAFFAELQQQVTDEWRATAAGVMAAMAPLPPQQMVQRVCALVIGLIRGDAGFIRSALKHASTHPGSWSPIKQVGLDVVAELVPLLQPLLGHLKPAQRELRVRVAMQVVFATGLNGVLNDPGPLHLADTRLERELAWLMAAYLELPVPTPARQARQQRPPRQPRQPRAPHAHEETP